MPYVFQMLSLLLEIREGSGSIPEPYWALFPCLLVPALWDRPGNVTPLIRLITAFIKQGSAQIVALGKLVIFYSKINILNPKPFNTLVFFTECRFGYIPENDCLQIE